MNSLSYRWKRYGGLLAALLLVSLVAAACATEEAEKPTIKLSDTQYESLWINNAIAKFVIEEGYGYPVESVEMTTPIAWATLAKGDIHLNMEMWQQNVIDIYNKEIAAGNILNGGMTYEGGPQFFTIPKYFAEEYNITSVEDMKRPEVVEALADPEDPSKGLFINCIIGWQCAEINRAKFQSYGLDEYYTILSPGASAAMDAAMSGAQNKNEPVFGYYWAPTSLMGKYEWLILKEPEYTADCWAEVIKGRDDATYTPAQACAYETLPIEKGIWSGLPDLAPDVVLMLLRMNVGLQPINETAAWSIDNNIQGEWEKAAVHYLETYEDRWTTWMPQENVDKIRDALAEATQ